MISRKMGVRRSKLPWQIASQSWSKSWRIHPNSTTRQWWDTIADGLQARLGDLTWPIVRDHVDDVITVEEEEIVNGMRLCYERMKVVVEPSGAVGLAAVVGDKFAERHGDLERVGVVLCGGNVDLNTRGFWESWRA